MQFPSAILIHPSGSAHNTREYLNTFRKVYGDKKGKQYRIWVDDVVATQLAPGVWLVKFDKWELCGMYQFCCLCSSHPFVSLKIRNCLFFVFLSIFWEFVVVHLR